MSSDVTRNGAWELVGVAGQAGRAGPQERGVRWDLTVADGVITALAAAPRQARAVPESSALVLVPLLVNAHDHGRGEGSLAAGVLDQPLETWLDANASPAHPSDQAALVGRAAQALLTGGMGASVLCIAPQQADLAQEIRTAVGDSAEAVRRQLDRVEELAEELASPGLDLQLAPRVPPSG